MYTLHKLPQGLFIVTSDEQIKEGDSCYRNTGVIFVMRKELSRYYESIKDLSAHNEYKLIAQQDQIDFSALKEEEQKEIGIYYEPVVEGINSAWSYLNALGYFTDPTNEGRVVENLLIQARVRSQELLSDRRFSLEDIRNAISFGVNTKYTTLTPKGIEVESEKFIQSLSQQSWKVELEMNTWFENGYDGKIIPTSPKLTNGKIKILKLCYSK
jgi:hypothetical protein